ncbi:MAG: hypothetical protein P8N43_16175, partial [Alphaproteobacteria bacterium]|nr:hypothetical protein [Alphaproteobacteria bacterium]
MMAIARSFIRIGALGALLAVTFAPLSKETWAAGDLSSECVAKLEQARLWIRATDPLAPKEEKAKVQGAVQEANAACEAARQAAPKDGAVLVNAAYALFAMGDTAAG